MSVTQEIKNRLDIVDVVTDYGVQLRKSGSSYAGFCPFHANTKTPAFYVFPSSQTWRCFGACAEGGDVFSFVMKKNGWDFKETLADLARRAGVELEPQRPQDPSRQAAEDRLFALLAAAADYYHMLLLHAPQAKQARDYVERRGLTEETLAAFRLGFSLDSWDAARAHFTGQGYREDELIRAGLLTEHEERKTHYDRFRGRLMFPIRDVEGRVVGFGARTLDPDGIPKYLNSPQTPLFDKSHLVYGIDMAKRHIREAREVVIVEGYMDAIQAWQAGFRNVIAQMGTALTEAQLQTLQRYSKRFIIALDADAAGAKATLRSLQVARDTLDRDVDVRFDARGLVRTEGRLKADIRIVTLPPGDDPDSIIRRDPTAWPKLLADSKPVAEYVIDVLTADLDMSDGKAKSAVAQQVLPLINDIADPVERDHFLGQLARRLGVSEESLRRELSQLRAQGKTAPRPSSGQTPRPATGQAPRPQAQTTRPATPPPPPDDWDPMMPDFGPPDLGVPDFGPPDDGLPGGRPLTTTRRGRHTQRLEENFLRQLLAYPGALSPVNALLRRQKQPELSPADFTAAEDRAIFPTLQERATSPTVAPIDEMCDSLEAVLAERVRQLLKLPPTPEKKLDRLPETLTLSVLDWRSEKVKLEIDVLQGLILSAGADEGEAAAVAVYREQIEGLRSTKRSIDLAKNALSAIGRRRIEDATLRGR